MKNLRKYGSRPFEVAVVHGGPGAAGQVAEVARELSRDRGVLEPLQTRLTLDGQVLELQDTLEKNGDLPVKLVGHSWGAWLSFILAARCPEMVERLILVGSGPFREQDAREIAEIRLERLEPADRNQVLNLMNMLLNPLEENQDEAMARLGYLFSRADAYDPVELHNQEMEVSYEIHRSVWPQAWELRRSGELLELSRMIECPVLAIHGDYDPHPVSGVETPLKKALKDFQLVVIPKCGHLPWIEKQARDEFYDILKANLA